MGKRMDQVVLDASDKFRELWPETLWDDAPTAFSRFCTIFAFRTWAVKVDYDEHYPDGLTLRVFDRSGVNLAVASIKLGPINKE